MKRALGSAPPRALRASSIDQRIKPATEQDFPLPVFPSTARCRPKRRSGSIRTSAFAANGLVVDFHAELTRRRVSSAWKSTTSPLAANAEVRIDPDRLFGRHLAVLGNTGSGKSCSVAGLIRWSMDEARKARGGADPNARFIVLDPNGEYANTFRDMSQVNRTGFRGGSTPERIES